MATDVKGLKVVAGFLYPEDDMECCAAMPNEVWKIAKIPVNGRRVAIQAGGNVGVFPVELSKYFGKVFTFEPDITNFSCMERNLLAHGVRNVDARHAGLSDKAGTCGVFEPPNEPNNCGALQVQEGEGNIALVTIDSLALIGVDLIYLDVEGFEDLALLGARETIEGNKPTIVCENKGLSDRYPETPPNPSIEFRDWLCNEFGYEFHSRLMRDDIFVPCK